MLAHSLIIKGHDLIETDETGRILACNLDLKNPNVSGITDTRTPLEILENIEINEQRILEIMGNIKRTLSEMAQ